MLIVGTAGWNIPKQFADRCPSGSSHLARYSQVLNGVEINSSFKQWHQRKTYERWAETTPENFRFSVKLPMQVTHEARLANCELLLDNFATSVVGLGRKLHALLVQLPPTAVYDPSATDVFFDALSQRLPASVFIEPRNKSWFTPEANAHLVACRVGRVAADPALTPVAAAPGGWLDGSYYRLHGSPRMYYSAYDADVLSTLSLQIDPAKATWCVFDNTAAGAAFGNALDFAMLVHSRCG